MVTGLEMSLDRSESHGPGAEVATCYLACEENLESLSSSHANISSLSIFKKTPHAFSDNDSSEKGSLIASVTLQQPTLSRVMESLKVNGLLEVKRSTIHIEMLERADCIAAYTCEVRTVDSWGNVHISVNRLRQQQLQRESQSFTGTVTSALSVQLLAMVHQLDTKLALLSQSSAISQNKMDHLERRLDARLWSIEGKVNTIEPRLVVFPNEESDIDVPYLCDTLTDGGGWIIIQRRATGDVDFYRDWDSYKTGFGSLSGDFWLGNENIHKLTTKGVYELRVEIKFKGRLEYASYDKFSIGKELSKYTLRLGQYSGTAGDSLREHDGEPFSTHDKDHDLYNRNCAEVFTGAWWYKACHHSNLNGKWQATAYKGPNWQTLTQGDPVSFSEMKIRRKYHR
ncbi:hypothetical protein EGW08_022328 [Elysia chlorotica]|uniref:Fibrinogen C-terminal domain-containing protein n=1 Tax=Elysia chlorotica TaxID=188477 RepID=A0A433SL98_ELYCH|nr:hypothetical protein EGW08_022328 [Elysia chlorotica]